MDKIRWAAVLILLFLVIAIDFTSRIMSVLSDGVLVIGILIAVWPMIRGKVKE
ncbi:DUF3927 family protein [Rahnella aceris]|uniref:DUF3927 family protein n=1 Tax=Rahnella sp. (strain Y9602) TaxID=2703885 RepID=UPI001C27305A|nr:DUF3927 family protein [Rahnella aceris]MBU9866780.1 DUF3927 family protein [Rahnella aceris]